MARAGHCARAAHVGGDSLPRDSRGGGCHCDAISQMRRVLARSASVEWKGMRTWPRSPALAPCDVTPRNKLGPLRAYHRDGDMTRFVTVTRSGCRMERGVEGTRVTCGGLGGAEQVTSSQGNVAGSLGQARSHPSAWVSGSRCLTPPPGPRPPTAVIHSAAAGCPLDQRTGWVLDNALRSLL